MTDTQPSIFDTLVAALLEDPRVGDEDWYDFSEVNYNIIKNILDKADLLKIEMKPIKELDDYRRNEFNPNHEQYWDYNKGRHL